MSKHKFNCPCDDCLESKDRFEDQNKDKHKDKRRRFAAQPEDYDFYEP
jgi:hypothetical protein